MRALFLACALAAIAVTITIPPRAGADNVVVATNSRDDSSVFRVSVAIRRVGRDVVDEANVAVAAGNGCDGCRTVAVAMEAVLVFREPEVFAPVNLAFAINVDCQDCETLASAYQWAFETGGPVHFTADGNRRLARLRHRLQSLRHEELTIWELQSVVQEVADELADVLGNEVVAAGRRR